MNTILSHSAWCTNTVVMSVSTFLPSFWTWMIFLLSNDNELNAPEWWRRAGRMDFFFLRVECEWIGITVTQLYICVPRKKKNFIFVESYSLCTMLSCLHGKKRIRELELLRSSQEIFLWLLFNTTSHANFRNFIAYNTLFSFQKISTIRIISNLRTYIWSIKCSWKNN